MQQRRSDYDYHQVAQEPQRRVYRVYLARDEGRVHYAPAYVPVAPGHGPGAQVHVGQRALVGEEEAQAGQGEEQQLGYGQRVPYNIRYEQRLRPVAQLAAVGGRAHVYVQEKHEARYEEVNRHALVPQQAGHEAAQGVERRHVSRGVGDARKPYVYRHYDYRQGKSQQVEVLRAQVVSVHLCQRKIV